MKYDYLLYLLLYSKKEKFVGAIEYFTVYYRAIYSYKVKRNIFECSYGTVKQNLVYEMVQYK